MGDYLVGARAKRPDDDLTYILALNACKAVRPRDIWKNNAREGAETAAWYARRGVPNGGDLLIATVADCWEIDDEGPLPVDVLRVLVNLVDMKRPETLASAAPAFEALFGKLADARQEKERLEGFGGVVSMDMNASQRHQALFDCAKAEKPKTAAPAKRAPEASDKRAWLPFHKPVRTPSPQKTRRSSNNTRGSSRHSSRRSARSSLSSATSRGSTADGLRLLMDAAPRLELPRRARREPLSRRLAPLPRPREPRKIKVHKGLPDHGPEARRRKRERARAEESRTERAKEVARRLVLDAGGGDALPALGIANRRAAAPPSKQIDAAARLGARARDETRRLLDQLGGVRVASAGALAARRGLMGERANPRNPKRGALGALLVEDPSGAADGSGLRAAVRQAKLARQAAARRREIAAGGGYFGSGRIRAVPRVDKRGLVAGEYDF